MKNTLVLKRATVMIVLGLGIFFSFIVPRANAQTASPPQFLVTWKVFGSYIPSFYTGKTLPSFGSKITASFELVSNGTILNIKSQTVYWYLDQVLIGGGTGIQQITFSPVGTPPSSLDLTIQFPSYDGGYLTHQIEIPMVEPEAVIYSPYPNNNFSTNPLVVKALPFFFDTASSTELAYTWGVNNQTSSNSESPQGADIILPQGTPSGSTFAVSLTIENPFDSTIATADDNLTYNQQL